MGPLGYERYNLGSIMESLVAIPIGFPRGLGLVHGATVTERVDSLKVHIAAISYDLGIDSGEQCQGGVRRANWSKMSTGRHSEAYPELMQKGGVVKNLLPVILFICEGVVGTHLPDDLAEFRPFLEYRILLLKGMVAIHEITDRAGQWLRPEEVRDFVTAVENVIAAACWLNKFYVPHGAHMFLLTVKTHYLNHIKEMVVENRFNPRYYWTVRDEDHLGRLSLIVKSSMKAGGAVRSSHTTTEKLCSGYVLRMCMLSRNIMRERWAVM